MRVLVGSALLLGAAACSPSEPTADEVVASNAGEAAADAGGSTSSDPEEGQPTPTTATLPDGIPDEYLPALAPLEIVGESLPEFVESQTDPAIGLRAPTLRGSGIDGNSVSVDATVDGPTMLVFLAHWCQHCNAELETLLELAAGGQLDGVNVVALATAPDPTKPNFPPTDWLLDNNWPYPALLEGVAVAETDDGDRQVLSGFTAFGGGPLPYSVLIGADGTVAYRWAGASSGDEIVSRLDEYLG